MFEKVLSKNAKNSLVILGKSDILKNVYMAGGTALALQIGHRFSYDFDFFTPKEFSEDLFVQRLKKITPDFKLDKLEWQTILGNIKETRFSLFFYNYPLLFKTNEFFGVDIANVKDIAAMKIAAIADRGTKRYFIDLYFIIEIEKILTLEEILELYDRKFKSLKQNNIHILKSLCYFRDAEESVLPKMIKFVSWRQVKSFFEKKTKEISKF